MGLSAEENFKQALELAGKRDKELAEAKRAGGRAMAELGILHGVPFSVKDQINMKGHLSTLGCAYLCDDRATEDAVAVQLFLRAGAIPLVRGNCPQLALSLHTNNLIWGEAKNPLRNERSCGGSSGGDAGLVASRCVPLGIGSDVAGSLRLPAAFCGIYGFKPTTYRFTKKGLACARKERFNQFNYLLSGSGPLGNTVDDLIVGTKVHCDPDVHKLDSLTPPCPWNDDFFAGV